MPSDQEFLRTATRPDYETPSNGVTVVDLFSGCGGLTLGIAEGARRLGLGTDVRLAVDFDTSIARVYSANFPKARAEAAAVESFFDGDLATPLSAPETKVKRVVGGIDFLVGGPPCQGHSDLNNHSRRRDPRNSYYLRMARAAEVLLPRVVIVENVRPVIHDDEGVVESTISHLEGLGFDVATEILNFADLGVPQRRQRHTLLGLRDFADSAQGVLASLGDRDVDRSLRWAIGDLIGATDSLLDVPSKVASQNQGRIDWLFENDEYDLADERRPDCHRLKSHSYKSVYGRLDWDQPSQTITSGFGSMGQGRYVHPEQRRTLTPHEAARIQFFPDWFDFTANGIETRRTIWATMIGNAVPPKLTMELGRLLIPGL